MKNQGFTLIELISVIVLLGIILGLVFPNLVNQFQKKQKEINESKLKLVYSAAKDYCIENDKVFPCKTKLETLYNENYIPFDIKEYKEKEGYGKYSCIIVTKTRNNKYSYKHEVNC